MASVPNVSRQSCRRRALQGSLPNVAASAQLTQKDAAARADVGEFDRVLDPGYRVSLRQRAFNFEPRRPDGRRYLRSACFVARRAEAHGSAVWPVIPMHITRSHDSAGGPG